MCFDINECEENAHQCQHNCTNTDGRLLFVTPLFVTPCLSRHVTHSLKLCCVTSKDLLLIAVIAVESAVKYSFVHKCIQTRRKGQHRAELTHSPRLHVKQLITAVTAIYFKIILL